MSSHPKPAKTTTFEALLGILTMGPMTGYEIRQRIESSIGNFWNESFGQIYPALNKLQQQGLISATQVGKKGRKIYSLTWSGHEMLREWLAVMPQPGRPRNEMLLKLFFAAESDIDSARKQVLAARERFAADLERYLGLEAHLNDRQAKSPGLPFYLMTLNYGIAEAQAIIAWADQTLAALDHLKEKP